jgi:hypothetical protein
MASTNPQYLLQGVPSSSGEAAGNQWRVSPDDAEAFAFVSNSGSPKRKVILAVALLVIGTVLLFMGVGFYVQDRPGGKKPKQTPDGRSKESSSDCLRQCI